MGSGKPVPVVGPSGEFDRHFSHPDLVDATALEGPQRLWERGQMEARDRGGVGGLEVMPGLDLGDRRIPRADGRRRKRLRLSGILAGAVAYGKTD